MRKTILIFSAFSLLCIYGCGEKDTSFLITENSVGPLSSETTVSELEQVFVNDSISKDTAKQGSNKIEVYQKNGKHLLTLTSNSDSIPTVENIRIFDTRYKTNKGIGLHSTFKDIQDNYSIKKIVTTINSIVILPKESNLYFTIDKEELPSNLRYTSSKIEAVQIPPTSKIKYLMMGWE
ncbi:hypothetical protein [Flagellimonas sp. S3867]|uniref:hypothetical protein n=1 Tax=Flagellimonas sp. S3867 TaxID=2768063 RepID=UPI0016874181|nr:hypothetical protein [Flagellimonas sp. S3867]